MNLGSGQPRRIGDIGRALATLVGRDDLQPQVTGQFRRGDVRHCTADIARARETLGFAPRVAWEDGLRELLAWSRETIAADHFDRAHGELARHGLLSDVIAAGGRDEGDTVKRALITGSSGLIGSEAVAFFDQRGWEVHGIDNNMRRDFFGPTATRRGTWSACGGSRRASRTIALDIRDRAAMADVVRRVQPDLVDPLRGPAVARSRQGSAVRRLRRQRRPAR